MSFPITPVEGLIAGALAMGFLIAGLFFLKFWRRTGDGLFLAFAAAFGLLAVGNACRCCWARRTRSAAASTCSAWRPSC
jgi:hypothetical protein